MGYIPKGNCRAAASFTEGSMHAFAHSPILGEEFTSIGPEIAKTNIRSFVLRDLPSNRGRKI